MNKTKAMRLHARHRAWTRYGLDIHLPEMKRMVQMIQARQGRCVRLRTNRVSEWELEWRGRFILVLYDKDRHVIITFLTRNGCSGNSHGHGVAELPFLNRQPLVRS